MGSTDSKPAAAPADVVHVEPPSRPPPKPKPILLHITQQERTRAKEIYSALTWQLGSMPAGTLGAYVAQRATSLRTPFLPATARIILSLGVGLVASPFIVGELMIAPHLNEPEARSLRFKTLKASSELRKKYPDFSEQLVLNSAPLAQVMFDSATWEEISEAELTEVGAFQWLLGSDEQNIPPLRTNLTIEDYKNTLMVWYATLAYDKDDLFAFTPEELSEFPQIETEMMEIANEIDGAMESFMAV